MAEKAFDYIRDVRLIDDSFFEIFFKDDPKYIEVVIHEIFKQLGHPLVKIQKVSTQENLNSLNNREVRLDALATDENGNLVNIEVQRAVSRALTKRARYHSSLLDTNSLEKNSDFSELTETYVIFITESDYRGLGLPAYQVERVYLEDKTAFDDGTHIIFVNGRYRGDDPIGRLMNDFFSKGADEMKNEVLAERLRFFKECEEGLEELSEVDARSVARGRDEGIAIGREEGRVEEKLRLAKNLILDNLLPLETISKACGLSLEELEKIKNSIPNPA